MNKEKLLKIGAIIGMTWILICSAVLGISGILVIKDRNISGIVLSIVVILAFGIGAFCKLKLPASRWKNVLLMTLLPSIYFVINYVIMFPKPKMWLSILMLGGTSALVVGTLLLLVRLRKIES